MNVDAIGRHLWRCPVKVNDIANAIGGQILHYFRQIQ
jgi:hypothetical protein